ncbi:MAG: AmmeMemoRadiSam system protein B [Acidimicrobiia bacterium]|nr:AmmeMemoRadiSam system protein B [Acidimicrobiia bacterium]
MTWRSPYCGSWYPAGAGDLTRLLDRCFAQSADRCGDYLMTGAKAYLVPHAGLVYSGAVSAAVWRHLRDQGVRRVVLLGFRHRGGVRGLAVPDLDHYETPLGEVAVDRHHPFQLQPAQQHSDHSVEIQLPFLRYALPDATLLPVYVGQMTPEETEWAALRLAELIDAGAVLVASSDFTHYGRDFQYRPFEADEHVAGRLARLDGLLMEASGSLEPGLFQAEIDSTESNLCGGAPIRLLQRSLQNLAGEEIFQRTLDYQTSGEITGSFSHSVSYAALGYFPASSFQPGNPAREKLLELARTALAHYETNGERPHTEDDGGMRGAAFVTLREQGELRGCVGRITGDKPLSSIVPGLALSAALDDSRFETKPVRAAALDIEISLLTPFKRIDTPERIEAGRHGAHLECGDRRGLLLPQVASDRGWSRDQFLEALSVKAGGHRKLYREPEAKLSLFLGHRFSSEATGKVI